MNARATWCVSLFLSLVSCSEGHSASPETTLSHAATESNGEVTLEDDLTYPGAEQIFRDWKIRLLKGDGNIVFAECDESPQRIEVWSYERSPYGAYCFLVRGHSGFLTVEIPRAYGIFSIRHKVTVKATQGTRTFVQEVVPDEQSPIGDGTGSLLLELRVHP